MGQVVPIGRSRWPSAGKDGGDTEGDASSDNQNGRRGHSPKEVIPSTSREESQKIANRDLGHRHSTALEAMQRGEENNEDKD